MPELPEVETVRLGLEPVLKGAQISAVTLRRAGLRAPFSKHFAPTLKGARVTTLRRRGKYILIDLDNGHVWLVHLGMTGSFRVLPGGRNPAYETHDHVVLALSGGKRLVFNDPRRFGQMEVFAAGDEMSHPSIGARAMGPEPLDASFKSSMLGERLLGKKTPIKVALLDQKIIAGVGNIYASEALFHAGIDPRRGAGTLTKAEITRLRDSIRKVLRDALKSGGSTLRNYRQIDGNTGFFQHSFAVYGQEGQRCPGCTCKGKHSIEAITQAGRSTFFCPVKQR